MKWNLNDPSFPTINSENAVDGMTIRQYAYIQFAAAAIQGLNANHILSWNANQIAEFANEQACEMLDKMKESE